MDEEPKLSRDIGGTLLRIMEVLSSALAPNQVLGRLARETLRLTNADRSVIFVLEGDLLVPRAAAAKRRDEDLYRRFRSMPPISLTELGESRASIRDGRLVVVEDALTSPMVPERWSRAFEVRSLIVAPLAAFDEPLGVLVVAYMTPHVFPEDELEIIRAIANAARIALGNASLTEDLRVQVAQTKALHRLSQALTGLPQLSSVLEDLNGGICADLGLRCVETAFTTSRVAQLTGSRVLSQAERRRISSRADAKELVFRDSRIAAPIRFAGRFQGFLFVESLNGRPPSRHATDFVETIASGIGDVVYKMKLQALVSRMETRAQLLAARRRLAEHLDRTAGSTLSRLWEALSELLGKHHDAPEVVKDLGALRNLASRGMIEVQTASESLAVLRVHSDGLRAALRALVAGFGRLASISTSFRVHGSPRQLPIVIEEELYAIVFDALSTVQRASRASTVTVELRYGSEVQLVVRDDGVGLSQRDDGGRPGVHYGLGSIRDRTAQIHGDVSFEAVEPRGMRMTVSLRPDEFEEERAAARDQALRMAALRALERGDRS